MDTRSAKSSTATVNRLVSPILPTLLPFPLIISLFLLFIHPPCFSLSSFPLPLNSTFLLSLLSFSFAPSFFLLPPNFRFYVFDPVSFYSVTPYFVYVQALFLHLVESMSRNSFLPSTLQRALGVAWIFTIFTPIGYLCCLATAIAESRISLIVALSLLAENKTRSRDATFAGYFNLKDIIQAVIDRNETVTRRR